VFIGYAYAHRVGGFAPALALRLRGTPRRTAAQLRRASRRKHRRLQQGQYTVCSELPIYLCV